MYINTKIKNKNIIMTIKFIKYCEVFILFLCDINKVDIFFKQSRFNIHLFEWIIVIVEYVINPEISIVKQKVIILCINYVTNTYKYNDIVWDDVEKILHENIISHNSEINVYKNESDMRAVLPFFSLSL